MMTSHKMTSHPQMSQMGAGGETISTARHPRKSASSADETSARRIAGIMPAFKPVPLRQQLAATIADDLRRGRWKAALPGLRQLAALYGVNKRTCTEALRVLEKQGLLEPARPRERRRIRPVVTSSATPRIPGQLLIIADKSERGNNTHLRLMNRAMRLWNERGGEVRQVEVDFTRGRSPAKLKADLFSGARVECVLLIKPPMRWAEALDALDTPVFMYGGAIPKSSRNITAVGSQLNAVLVGTLDHIRRMGHRRLLLPCHRPFRELRARCIDLVRAAYPDATPEQAEDMVPSVDLLDGRDWAAFWNRALPRLKPTCVIVWSSLEALSLVSYCARTGLRVPRDLSVVALDGNDLMDWFEQPLTHVEADNEADWKAFLRWVDEGCRHDGHIDTPCRFVEGATVATLRP